MTERRHVDADGVEWTFVERPRMRMGERQDWVVLIATSANETRVARWPRQAWMSGDVDMAKLLAESVPAGASRGR